MKKSAAGERTGLTAGELRGEKSLETLRTESRNRDGDPETVTLGNRGDKTSGEGGRTEETTGSGKWT